MSSRVLVLCWSKPHIVLFDGMGTRGSYESMVRFRKPRFLRWVVNKLLKVFASQDRFAHKLNLSSLLILCA